jgi:hypothetical protein
VYQLHAYAFAARDDRLQYANIQNRNEKQRIEKELLSQTPWNEAWSKKLASVCFHMQ